MIARRGVRRPTAKAATLSVLAAGYLLMLAANLPGQLSYDSVVQLADGRSGRYHTWHPPIMAWLLGLGDWLLPGTALYLTAVTAVIFGALAVSVAVRPRVSWATPVLTLLICLSPLMVMDQGIVWKDMLFANSAVAGFLLLFVAAAPERDPVDRRVLAVLAVALFALAALARQNGLIASVFGMGALGYLIWRSRPEAAARPRLLRAGAIANGGLAVILVVTIAATLALDRRAAPGAGGAGQVRLLKLYDLVGSAKRDPSVDLAPLGPVLARQVRDAEAVYTPERLDAVAIAPGVADAVLNGAPGLDAAWRGAIRGHPAAWASHRLDVFRWMIAPPRIDRCLPVYTGVDGPLDVMTRLGLTPTWRAQDLRLARYAELFLPTPLYIHAVWAMLAAGLMVGLGRSPARQDHVLAIMLASALTFTASFLLIGGACDHRYLYALDLATIAALIHVTAALRFRRRPRPDPLRARRVSAVEAAEATGAVIAQQERTEPGRPGIPAVPKVESADPRQQ